MEIWILADEHGNLYGDSRENCPFRIFLSEEDAIKTAKRHSNHLYTLTPKLLFSQKQIDGLIEDVRRVTSPSE